jgi:hypothetical protein
MRHGDYPPPRGACLDVGDRSYLYTTGYVLSLGRYPHGHVPTPVQITDHVGDSSAKALLAEVLLMTKMNWNSARFAEKLPVTLRFANEVGTILRDLPGEYTPQPPQPRTTANTVVTGKSRTPPRRVAAVGRARLRSHRHRICEDLPSSLGTGPRNEMGSRLSTKGRLEYRAEGFAHYSSKVRILE